MNRLTLGGYNNQRETRTVYLDGEEIGDVRVKIHDFVLAWEAIDIQGRSHGSWLTDWYAAEALVRALGTNTEHTIST